MNATREMSVDLIGQTKNAVLSSPYFAQQPVVVILLPLYYVVVHAMRTVYIMITREIVSLVHD